MKKYEVIVIGGGFSGLIAAINLSENFGGQNVLVVEKNDRIGKKILATGNGRGNISNVNVSAEHYHSHETFKGVNIIEKYGYKSIIDYFLSLGVPVSKEGDKFFPSSFQASSILDMMRLKLDYLQTDIKIGEECALIERQRLGYIVKTSKGEYFSEKVIFAVGGKSGKQYGTDGSALEILKKLGISVTPLYPTIVQLKTNTEFIKGLKNLKEKATVSAYDGKVFLKSFFGDVLFTDYGISGNAVFFLSSYLVGAKKPVVKISFSDKTEGELVEILMQKAKLPYLGKDDILTGVINKQIGRAIVKRSSVQDLSLDSIKKIAWQIKNFELTVTGSLGFDYAQATRGGVSFSELGGNLESNKLKGMYVIGEAVDVDGDCGGFNLQWAYSSACAATDDIIKRSKKDENR